MYRQDFLMRQLNAFLQRLTELLTDGNSAPIDKEVIEPYYNEMLGLKRSDMMKMSVADILKDDAAETFTRERLRILAELFYVEAMAVAGEERRETAEKSLRLFQYLDEQTKTYDFDIKAKIGRLTGIIAE